MRVHSLHAYPVKSAAGTAHEGIALGLKGLAGDRRWMIVDEQGVFVSQREVARLAFLGVAAEPDGLRLRVPGEGELFVARPGGDERLSVIVWKDRVDAALAGTQANAALSRWLGQECRLVYFDDRASRSVSRDWVERDTPVGFADGFPLLVTARASLDEMNRRIERSGGAAVPMDRFRPNLVIEQTEPFAEDGWATIEASGVVLDLVKPCARCVVTTVDQQTGERTGKEPLATLARSHRSADPRAPGALFGWNAVPRGQGYLRVGDPVRVLRHRETPWPIA